MKTTYSIFAFTNQTLERFVVYQVDIDDKDKLTAVLSPNEIAMAKVIRYVYEHHGGYLRDFTIYDESTGNISSPGMFGGVGGPKEVPSPSYMTIKEAIAEHDTLLKSYDEDEISTPEQIMLENNNFEDELINSIKRRKYIRKELLNKIINTWNVPTDGVIVRHGIDKFDENSLC